MKNILYCVPIFDSVERKKNLDTEEEKNKSKNYFLEFKAAKKGI